MELQSLKIYNCDQEFIMSQIIDDILHIIVIDNFKKREIMNTHDCYRTQISSTVIKIGDTMVHQTYAQYKFNFKHVIDVVVCNDNIYLLTVGSLYVCNMYYYDLREIQLPSYDIKIVGLMNVVLLWDNKTVYTYNFSENKLITLCTCNCVSVQEVDISGQKNNYCAIITENTIELCEILKDSCIPLLCINMCVSNVKNITKFSSGDDFICMTCDDNMFCVVNLRSRKVTFLSEIKTNANTKIRNVNDKLFVIGDDLFMISSSNNFLSHDFEIKNITNACIDNCINHIIMNEFYTKKYNTSLNLSSQKTEPDTKCMNIICIDDLFIELSNIKKIKYINLKNIWIAIEIVEPMKINGDKNVSEIYEESEESEEESIESEEFVDHELDQKIRCANDLEIKLADLITKLVAMGHNKELSLLELHNHTMSVINDEDTSTDHDDHVDYGTNDLEEIVYSEDMEDSKDIDIEDSERTDTTEEIIYPDEIDEIEAME